MSSVPSDHPGKVTPAGPGSPADGNDAAYALAALGALWEGVVMQLASGEIVSCNPAAERILGLTRDQMMGWTSVDPRWRSIHEDGSPFPGETHPAMVTLRTGESLRNVVMGVHTPGGSLRWISINSEPIPGADGRPASVVTTFVDITDRRLADEAARRGAEGIRRSEEKYHRIVDTANEGIWQIDAESKTTFVNQRKEQEAGRRRATELLASVLQSSSDVIAMLDREHRYTLFNTAFHDEFLRIYGKDLREGDSMIQALAGHPEDLAHALDYWNRALEGQEVLVTQEFGDAKLARSWYELRFSPVRSVDGAITGAVHVVRNVTERKRTEEALRASEGRFRSLFEGHSAVMLLVEAESGQILDANEAASSFYGYGRAKLRSMHIDEINALPPVQVSAERLKAIGRKSNHFVFPHRLASGEERTVEVHSSPIESERGPVLFSIIHDVTDRQRAEDALRNERDILRQAEEIGQIGSGRYDIGSGKWEVSEGWRRIHGVPADRPLSTEDLLRVVHPEEAEQITTAFQSTVSGKAGYHQEHRIVREADGAVRIVRVQGELIRDAEGRPTALSGVVRDVTERRRAEEELRQSEQNLRSFFDTIKDFIFILDETGRIVHANRVVWDRLGYAPDDLIGRGVLEVHPVERREEAGRIVAAMLAGEAQLCLVPLLAKDGTTIPVEARVVRGNWSGRVALFGISKDLSDLQASEERFEKAFRSNPCPMTLRSMLTGRILDVNDTFVRDLGYSREEVIGQTSIGLGAIPDEDRLHEAERLAGTGGTFSDVEMAVRARDGRILHGLFSGEVVDLAHEQVLLTVMKDVTQLRQAEAARREGEAKFRLLAENSTDVIGVLSADGFIKYVSPACLKMSGRNQEELIGTRPSDLFHPEDRDAVERTMARHAAGDELARARYRVQRKDGSVVWAERITRAVRDSGSGEILEYQFSDRDITETKQAEDQVRLHRDHLEELVAERTASLVKTNAALEEVIDAHRRTEKELRESREEAREGRAMLEAALASMTDSLLITDASGTLVEFNDAFVKYYRFGSREECFGRMSDYPSLIDVFFDDDEGPAPPEMWAVPRALGGETGRNAECKLRRKDTGETWFGSYNFAPIRDRDGHIVGAVVMGSDITERKRAEEVLAASRRVADRKNEELRALFESASAAMALYDAKPPFRLLTCNRRFQDSYPEPLRTTGMIGLSLPEFAPAAVTTGILDAFKRVAETGQAASFREFPYDGFPGGRSWWDWHVAPVATDGKVVALAFVRIDVTMTVRARKRVEAEMFHVKEANRELEAFSYSVSHDLRTPLRAVNGYSSLLEGHLGGALDQEGRRLICTIKSNSTLMGSLVDGLVEYTRIRLRDLARTRVDMKELARSVVAEVLTEEEQQRFEVHVADLPSTYVDRDLVAALLKHLLSNAVKFSAGQPKPVVEVGFGAGPDGPVYFVKDNGVGFDPKYTDKLFGVFHRLDGPPAPGRTGIGLAMAKRIAERHGGWIRAEGIVGGGATFRFSLVPTLDEPEASE